MTGGVSFNLKEKFKKLPVLIFGPTANTRVARKRRDRRKAVVFVSTAFEGDLLWLMS